MKPEKWSENELAQAPHKDWLRSGLIEGLSANKVMKWKEYTVKTAELGSAL